MKKSIMLLSFMAYATCIAAIIEGICQQTYVSGLVSAIVMYWLGVNLYREAKRYE
jgi:hypothetical protein